MTSTAQTQIYLFGSCWSQKIFETSSYFFYRKQGYKNINHLDYFQWFVKVLRFYNACKSQAEGLLIICEIDSFVPRLCLESKYLFQEIEPETHRKLVVTAVMLLEELQLSEVLEAKTSSQLASLKAELTFAPHFRLTNENFIRIYIVKFTGLVHPFFMEVAASL